MGIQYRRRIKVGRNAWLNLSTHGISASGRVGRATANTRGGFTFRLLKGLIWRSR